MFGSRTKVYRILGLAGPASRWSNISQRKAKRLLRRMAITDHVMAARPARSPVGIEFLSEERYHKVLEAFNSRDLNKWIHLWDIEDGVFIFDEEKYAINLAGLMICRSDVCKGVVRAVNHNTVAVRCKVCGTSVRPGDAEGLASISLNDEILRRNVEKLLKAIEKQGFTPKEGVFAARANYRKQESVAKPHLLDDEDDDDDY